jgi:hypothetical protein
LDLGVGSKVSLRSAAQSPMAFWRNSYYFIRRFILMRWRMWENFYFFREAAFTEPFSFIILRA